MLSKVIPTIDVHGTRKDTASLVKCHIEGLKTGVAKHWKDKNYAALHDVFVRLEQAQLSLRNHPKILPASSSNDLRKEVEDEIDRLADEVKAKMLRSEAEAFHKM